MIITLLFRLFFFKTLLVTSDDLTDNKRRKKPVISCNDTFFEQELKETRI